MDNEPFSNPLAPPQTKSDTSHQSERSQPLTNDDFRKLMMTPRAVMQYNQSNVPGTVRGSVRNKHGRNYKPKIEPNENVKKKKKIYEIIRKQDGDVLHELAKKYRDRAKERRDGTNSDSGRGSEMLSNTAYHAVGPDNFDMNSAERRKQLIQESKFLGGDMEHTHLVKGLDYALLQKVKAEIQSKEEEELFLKKMEEEEAKKEKDQKKKSLSAKQDNEDDSLDDQDRYALKSKKAENLLKIIFNKNLPERNELFLQGRMAYQYDLLNEFLENEIPTTIIRSKAECPNLDIYNSISTNEIILNKLIQIWTYIRHGASKKQKRKFESNKNEINKNWKTEKLKFQDHNIYDDIGEYIPDIKPKRCNPNFNNNRKSYFESKNSKYEDEVPNSKQKALEMAASVVGTVSAINNSNLSKIKKSKLHHEPESYAECYPGAPENDDAILDSDDETDYGQMESNKKVQINRWDFDNVEDYGDYMSNKEVMPKAAFQYGLKTNDGRKTRRLPTKKDDKAKLDREYQQINALINKKKQKGEKIGMLYIPDDYGKNH